MSWKKSNQRPPCSVYTQYKQIYHGHFWVIQGLGRNPVIQTQRCHSSVSGVNQEKKATHAPHVAMTDVQNRSACVRSLHLLKKNQHTRCMCGFSIIHFKGSSGATRTSSETDLARLSKDSTSTSYLYKESASCVIISSHLNSGCALHQSQIFLFLRTTMC